eukprot:691771-Hanusia_phi.AAC.1
MIPGHRLGLRVCHPATPGSSGRPVIIRDRIRPDRPAAARRPRAVTGTVVAVGSRLAPNAAGQSIAVSLCC